MISIIENPDLPDNVKEQVLQATYKQIKDTTSLKYEDVIYEINKSINGEDRPTRIVQRN